jgi:hypothetical protein
MKNNNLYWFLFGAAIVISGLLGGFLTKKFIKPTNTVHYDTMYVSRVDTVIKTIYLSAPKPDTFYAYDILVDTFGVDTASILADYNKTYEYNDTIVKDKNLTVTLSEKTHKNRIEGRVVNFTQLTPVYVEPVISKNARLYLGGEIGASVGGLTTASLGVGLKTKKDFFFLLNNNFAEGLKVNIGFGAYFPITK